MNNKTPEKYTLRKPIDSYCGLNICTNPNLGDVIKWHILSPDMLPITDKPFDTKKEAQDYIPGWCEHFESQGYYAGVGYRLPLHLLPDCIEIVPVLDSDTD